MAKNELRLEGTPRNESVHLNGVDLSYRNVTSVPLGMLIPTMVQEVVGKSKVRIGLESQTRCRPLVVPSFVRIREHFDYFFVPYSQLWHQYDNFKTMQGNYNSTLIDNHMNSELPQRVPCFKGTGFDDAVQDAFDNNVVDVAGYNLSYGMLRLADNLGYGIIQARQTDGIDLQTWFNISLNPFRALAYQKIYFDYYRNDKYEGNYPNHYNIDDLKFDGTASLPNAPFTIDRLQRMFEPHYRWKKKDYFTSVWPNDIPNSSLFGFEGFVSSFRFYIGNTADFDFSSASSPSFNGISPYTGEKIFNSSPNANVVDVNGEYNRNNVPSSVGALVTPSQQSTTGSQLVMQSQSIHRLLAAQERYLRKLYAAKQNFPSIMKAIFGYAPNIGRNGSVMHLGGVCNRISVSDVNNTASFEDLGVNGKINNYGSSNKVVDDFEVPEDGLIMCIYSTSVENDYRSNQLNRHNIKSYPEEFYNPNYEMLGRQPIFGFEYRMPLFDTEATESKNYVRVLGYTERYLEYKTHVDEVHGCFATDSFAPYSAFTNNDLDFTKPLSLTSLILKPTIFDRLIAGGTYDGKTESDHFYLNIYNKVDCLTPIKVGDGI